MIAVIIMWFQVAKESKSKNAHLLQENTVGHEKHKRTKQIHIID